jgi:hypothetical protein
MHISDNSMDVFLEIDVMKVEVIGDVDDGEISLRIMSVSRTNTEISLRIQNNKLSLQANMVVSRKELIEAIENCIE